MGGYDVQFPIVPIGTYFAQFTLSVRISGHRGTFSEILGTPYYQFRLRKRPSRQHDLLTRLEQENVFNLVEYVAPAFVRGQELATLAQLGTIRNHCLRVRPYAINAMVDDVFDGQSHYVGGRSPGPIAAASAPVLLSNATVGDPRQTVTTETAVLPDDEWADSTLATLEAIMAASAEDVGRLDYSPTTIIDTVGALDREPFGKVSAACRLFFGGELIPLAVPELESEEDEVAVPRYP